MGIGGDDLFALAGSVAELLGAPVTIEDTDTVVLAYSAGAQAVDEVRVDTILGRRVPPQYRELLSAAGVFEHLRNAVGVVYVDLGRTEMTPRAAIAVRDGDEMIGAIWAAVPNAPIPAQEAVLSSAAPVVARQMVRERARADVARRNGATLVSDLLTGGPTAVTAAEALRIDGPLTVAAIGTVDPDATLPRRVLGSVGLHLDALAARAVITQLDQVAYAVIGAPESVARRIMGDYTSRTPAPIVIGVGRTVEEMGAAHRSRADADRVLLALRHDGCARVVSGLAGSLATVLALAVADTVTELSELSPLTRLAELDRRHGSELVASVRTYLDHAGDVAASAAALHVHPNTLRNRVRRVIEAGVQVDDPDTRLVLALHLKVDGRASVRSHIPVPGRLAEAPPL